MCNCRGMSNGSIPLGAYASHQATVDATVVDLVAFGFTAQEVADAKVAYVFINTEAIRVDWSGNSPTTLIGALYDGWFGLRKNSNISNLEMVRDDATDAEVFIVLGK